MTANTLDDQFECIMTPLDKGRNHSNECLWQPTRCVPTVYKRNWEFCHTVTELCCSQELWC